MRSPASWVRWLAMAMLAAGSAAVAAPVHAYSSFADYMRPIEEGGGGGRLFTGTPADPYTCEVCHRGAQGAPLDVVGLPEDGYVPNGVYEITLRWPEEEAHIALIAEFTDAAGGPVGETALAPFATWQPGEACEDGFPAADICRTGDVDQAGCCLDLEPDRDACSFPGQRSVLWLLDCRSRFARVVWTAPPQAPGTIGGDVWFSVAMVTSDIENDALGDGVTLVRERLRGAGSSVQRRAAVGNCSVRRNVQPLAAAGWAAGLVGLIGVLRRRIHRLGAKSRARRRARGSVS